jgi:hypothetical protein
MPLQNGGMIVVSTQTLKPIPFNSEGKSEFLSKL